MERHSFPPGVADQLKWYVYRLIDPRNGETFYVGKRRDNRIFQHARGGQSATNAGDDADLKSQRVKDIKAAGLNVAHVIHRHNIDNQQLAFQIEAALIDAYPGLLNKVGGHGAGDYGCRHVEEIVSEYTSEPFEANESLILISIAKSHEEEGRSIYDAVRYALKVDVNRAKKYRLVLAHRQGLVVGTFRPKEWLEAKRANFPGLVRDVPGRWGFKGKPAEESTVSIYKGKRVPDKYRAKGASNPIRFVDLERPPKKRSKLDVAN